MDRQEALHRVYFLKHLPNAAIERLTALAQERQLQKSEMLFIEGDRCEGLVVVLRGAVKVYKLDSRGRELTLDLELPGETVAEVAVFDGGNWPANVEAAEEETRLLIVPQEGFRRVMADYPEIAELGLKALGIRMRK